LPLADSIVRRAIRDPKGAFKEIPLTDCQVWELEATYKNQQHVVAAVVIEKVGKKTFVFQGEPALIKYAAKALRMGIKSLCKGNQFKADEMPDGIDPVCRRDAFDSATRTESIARCLESRLLQEMHKMRINPKLRIALYFYYLQEQQQDQDHGGISRDGWVKLAVAANLSKQVGEEIAGLADYSSKMTGRWDKFAAKLSTDPNNLRRTVQNNLAKPINNNGDLFGKLIDRLNKECSDEWP
jgi:hypothetical protein